MSSTGPRVLLLFLDGVGLGADDPATNPFVHASLPTLHDLLDLGRITLAAAPQHGGHASLVAVDATLGFEGTPQSGTGQATLFTGVNAVARHGRHFGPWVPARLRDLVRRESVLARARDAGHSTAFANAYPEEVMRDPRADRSMSGQQVHDTPVLPAGSGAGKRARHGASFLHAGPPLAAVGAGLLTRHTPELVAGTAVASEITNEGWRERLGRTEVPVIDAVRAGHNLARIAMQHELTLFAHYSTDYAGHRQDMAAGVRALEKVDAFLAGVLTESADDMVTFIISDHGNIEDVSTGHTRNPAIGMVIGNGHAPLAGRLRSLMDVTPVILDVLSIET